jgi:Tol biopolymer transport system component
VTATSSRTRIVAFALLVGVALMVGVAAVVLAGGKGTAAKGGGGAPASARALLDAPHMLFRETARGDGYGRVAIVPLANTSARPVLTGMSCDRVYVAGGRGVCLFANRGVITTYKGVIFDAKTFRPQRTFSLPGNPSRARVSADGRFVAYTVFVVGDGYGSQGFSTRTFIRDTASGRQLAQLERFTTYRDGHVIHAADFNFWGVTFARDDNTFYATLGTAGRTFLVKGDLARRRMTVVTDGVECPSLSPDGTRIAFKQREGGGIGPVRWRPAVLDLATLRRHTLADARNLDDQIEWYDNDHVSYGLPESQSSPVTDLWKVPADGSGRPQRVTSGAWSPAVVRAKALATYQPT